MRFNVLVFFWAFVFAAGLLSAVDVDSCRNITSAGTYVLTHDLSGWNGTTDMPLAEYDSLACINIKANNVVLDCQNHLISSRALNSVVAGRGPVYGIVLQRNEEDHISGVTVKNCLVMGYSAGIMAYNTDNSRFINNTLMYNSNEDPYADWGGEGFELANEGKNNLLQDNKAFENGLGFVMTANDNNTLLRNNASYNNEYGFLGEDYIGYCDNNTYTNNFASSNGRDGFGFVGCSFNKLKNNVAENNSEFGFSVRNNMFASQNNFTSNNASFNENAGFFIIDDNTSLTGNIALENGRGFVLAAIMDFPPIEGLASGHEGKSHDVPAVRPLPEPTCYGTCYNVLRNNSAIDNEYGFLLDSVSNNTLDRNYAEGNMEGFSIQYNVEAPEYNVLSNNYANNSETGFGIEGGYSNLLVNNTANNSLGGFLLADVIFEAGINSASIKTGTKDTTPMTPEVCVGACNNTLRDNYAERSEYGYYLTRVWENHLDGNIANDTTYGFYLTDSSFNDLDNNTAVEAYSGFYISDYIPRSYNNLTNNKASECYYGFSTYQAEYNYLFNNTAYNNYQAGFFLSQSHDNLLYKNTAYNNSQYCRGESSIRDDGMSGGFILYESDYNNLSNNLAHNNLPDCDIPMPQAAEMNSLLATPSQIPFDFGTGYGFEYSEYNVLQESESYNNSFGLVDVDYYAPTLTLNAYVHNNLVEMLYLPYSYGASLGNPKGTMREDDGHYFNITNSRLGPMYGIGVNMTVESYQDTLLFLNDTRNTEAPPEGYTSFHGKCIDSEMETDGYPDFVAFHWAPYEGTYNISSLAVFRLGEGWNMVEDQELDIPNRTITLYEYNLEGTYCLFAQTGPEEPSGNQQGSTPELGVSFERSCDGNTITVTSGSGPVAGVAVSIDGSSIGTTGDDGTIKYKACGSTARVHASKDGYRPGDQSFDMVSCEQCAKPECEKDSDCPDTKMCSEQKCVAVECSCGSVSQHQCTKYECCSNGDCSENQICMDHSCRVKPGECKAPSCCTADSMCGESQNCLTVSGAQGSVDVHGTCKDITGQCGQAKGHQFVSYGYECGTEPGCPSCQQGATCTDHKCVSGDLKGPQTGFVGDSAKVQATEGDGVCKDCDIQGVDPTGKNFTGKTGPDGSFSLPLTLQGTYKVSLLKDGAIVKTIQINSLPKAPAEEPVKPTATGGTEIFSLIGLLVLLLVVILGVVYWRSTAKKK